jgi:hypothetical protein
MRTRSEMIDRMRRLLGDTAAAAQFSAESALVEMENAWGQLVLDLLDHESRRVLRKHSAWTSLVADQEEYDLPADCLELDQVEVRWLDADRDRYTTLRRAPPPPGAVASGSARMYATGGSGTGWPLAWWDDCDEGAIRIWPALGSVAQEKYRFRYFRRPAFLEDDDDATFNDPAAAGTDTESFPDQVVDCVEYYACALLALEELEDGRPVGAFGNMYSGTLGTLKSTLARGRTRQRRGYVQMIRKL